MLESKTVQDWLNCDKPLQRLVKKAKCLSELNAILANYLDAGLCQHCTLANYAEGELTLLVDSPAWATRLRFILPNLLSLLKKHKPFNQLTSIRHIVQQPPIPNKRLVNRTPVLTELCAEFIKQTAQHIEDPGLADALMRLAGERK